MNHGNKAQATQCGIQGAGTHHQFKRDFSHIDGLAAELVAFTNTAGGLLLIDVADNGTIEGTIRELAETVKQVVGYEGDIAFDVGKPDGTLRKLMGVSRLNAMGCRAGTAFEAGLLQAYADFQIAG